MVDLAGCVEALREGGYAAWLTIEVGYTRRTPVESVAMSQRYLMEQLGLSM